MGQFFQIKCRECGNEEFYNLGIGFVPLENSAYEEILNNPEYESLRENVHGSEDLYGSCYKAYYCKDCKTLENHISFKVHNIPSFIHHRKCCKCGKVMKGMDDLKNFYTKKMLVNCSKCGTEDIFNPEELLLGFWD